MRYFIVLLTLFFCFISCAQKEKQTASTEKEPAPTQNEPDLAATQTKGDSSVVQVAPAGSATVEQMVLDIRAEFKRINALRLTAKKHNFACETEGTITYYTDKGKVVKITIDWGFMGDGTSTSEYYYKDDKLFFMYETYTGAPADRPITTTEYRTYVNNDKAIKFMEDQKVTVCRKCEFSPSTVEYKALTAHNDTKNIASALCN